jgi:hypothetical protein
MRYLLVLLLTGCAMFGKTVPDAVLPPPEKTVHIDPRMLELCDPLIKLPEESTSFEDVLSITISNYELYVNCAQRQKNSVILIKQFSNKE